jgi:polyhydroxybutyrate depolymerase
MSAPTLRSVPDCGAPGILLLSFSVLLAACEGARPEAKPAPAAANPLVAARPYAVHVPAVHEGRAPLLVLMHGYGSDHANVEQHLGVDALADAHGVYVALPDGTRDPSGARFWNASDACCNFHQMPVDDVAYLDAILDDAFAHYPIDPTRVYVAGFSNGGFMAHRYACERAERIAAAVSFAGDPWKDASRCKPRVPVSILEVHGDADDIVPYAGGQVSDRVLPASAKIHPPVFPAVRDGIAMWAHLDGCADPARTDDAREETLVYAPCAAGTEVQLWTRHAQPHVLSWSRADSERMWGFLAAHARK